MKRKLMTLAVSSAMGVAMTAPAVAGDVTVYGHAQVELASVSFQTEGACNGDPADENTGNKCDGLDVTDNARGRVGFKASEDLGNGWKGLAKFEFKADTADGASDKSGNGKSIALTPREALVGLKGKAVTIEAGRLKSAYKYTGGVKYDPFVATTLQARGNGGMSGNGRYQSQGKEGGYGHNSFLPNHIGISGGSGPIKARLTYGAADGDGSMSFAVMFKSGGIEAFVALIDSGDKLDDGDTIDTGTATFESAAGSKNEYTATKIGGSFKTGPHKIMIQFEDTEWTLSDTAVVPAGENFTLSPTYMFVGYQLKMGKNTFVAQLGSLDSDDAGSDTDYVTLGVIHKFSKMTRLFGGFRQSDHENDLKEDIVSIGLRKDF